jgi:hypothetical protein
MCDCIEQVDSQLREQGACIHRAILISGSAHDLHVSPPTITVEWIGDKPRGKSLPVLMARCCPFCGEAYPPL